MSLYTADIKQNLLLLFRMDFGALLVQMALLCCGVLFVYNAGMDYGGAHSVRWLRQIVWIAIGGIAYFTCALADYRVLGRYSWTLFIGGIFLLCLVFLSGGGAGARSVLALPGTTFQASEPMKAAALLFVSWVLSHPILRYSSIPPIFIWCAVIIIPFGIVMLQHDWGTALVFLPFSYAILFLNGMKKRWLLFSLLAVVLVSPIFYHFMAPRHKERLLVFLKEPTESMIGTYEKHAPEALKRHLPDFRSRFNVFMESFQRHDDAEETDVRQRRKKEKVEWDNWNAKQAINSVGSGGVAGRGYGKGIQHTLGFLPRPVAPTDFIFSVIAEEVGFVGTSALLVLFTLLVLFACRTALYANSLLGASIALGAAVLYATHIVINIGMCVEIVPIIGIPLPFVSYGGSCIVTMMIVAGIVQSVHIHNKPPLEQELQDYD